KFLCFGKNEKLVVNTKLYDREANQLDIGTLPMGTAAFFEQPIFKLCDVYFGSNSKNDYVAYIQIRLASAIYEEQEKSSVPDFRDQLFNKSPEQHSLDNLFLSQSFDNKSSGGNSF